MNDLSEELRGFAENVIGEAKPEVEALLNDARKVIPPLEQFVRSMDKIMESANAIKLAAEKSDYSTLAMANAIRAHERQMGLVYGMFTKARSQFESVAKKADVPLRGAKGASRKKPAKADTKGMSQSELEADITRLYNGLNSVIRQAANDGAFFLAEMRKLGAKKNPAFDTVRGEVAALVQDFLTFRAGVYKFFGMLEGVVKRLNLRAKMAGDISMSRYKPKKPSKAKKKPTKKKKPKKEDIEAPTDEQLFESTHNRPPADPIELLDFSRARDHERGMGFFEKS